MSLKMTMGNAAFAYGAINAGVRVVSGYPGTPSSELLETIAAYNNAELGGRIHVEWSVNEKVALEVAAGAAISGARSLVTMKQVGLNVASDPLMSLVYIGISAGMVVFVADDPGPISSQTEQDTRSFAAFSHLPVFDTSSPEEAYTIMEDAFKLSETCGTPVIVRSTTRISHSSAPVDLDISWEPALVGGFKPNPKWVIFPKRAFEAHGEINQKLALIQKIFNSYAGNIIHNDCKNSDSKNPDKVAIVTGSISYLYVMEALSFSDKLAHNKIPVLKIATPYPFPEDLALSFLKNYQEIIVFEELDPAIERSLLELCGKHHLDVKILGKQTGHVPARGELSADIVGELLSGYFKQASDCGESTFKHFGHSGHSGQISDHNKLDSDCGEPTPHTSHTKLVSDNSDNFEFSSEIIASGDGCNADLDLSLPLDLELPPRAPTLCAGCPHRSSFYAIKKAVGNKKAYHSGDIGCYTLGNAAPLHMVDTCLCMGGGITMAQGMHIAEPDALNFAYIGDSTFFASGITGVLNAVYNKHNIILIVLDNSTTAMTGNQPHPGTGVRMTKPEAEDKQNAISIPKLLEAVGVVHIYECNPHDFEKSLETVKAAIKNSYTGELSAIVFNAPCIVGTEKNPPPLIEAPICTACRKCIDETGCPALELCGKLMTIDASLCSGCKLCTNTCPHNAILNGGSL